MSKNAGSIRVATGFGLIMGGTLFASACGFCLAFMTAGAIILISGVIANERQFNGE